jgi:hypothetical protein
VVIWIAKLKSGVDLFFDERLGIILGSLASGLVGYLFSNYSLKAKAPSEVQQN